MRLKNEGANFIADYCYKQLKVRLILTLKLYLFK